LELTISIFNVSVTVHKLLSVVYACYGMYALSNK